MPFASTIRALNELRRRRIIRDYALIGAVAATVYMEPVFTDDLDAIVLVDTDDEYRDTFRRIADNSEGQEGKHQILGGIPVQLFPSTVSPLYRDTVENARQVRVNNLRTKVASPEHLILLCLLANRERDRMRVRLLLPDVDQDRLGTFLERYDDAERTITSRLENLRGTSVPREGEIAPSSQTDEPGP